MLKLGCAVTPTIQTCPHANGKTFLMELCVAHIDLHRDYLSEVAE
jgi:hypothetical protein